MNMNASRICFESIEIEVMYKIFDRINSDCRKNTLLTVRL